MLGGIVALLGLPEAAAAQARPFEGLWGASRAACRDPDGVDRMEITGERFFWYETRCRAQAVAAAGPRSWTTRLACEGEGKRYTARPRLTLATPNRLILDNAPVGPAPRQVYIRCKAL